MNFKGMVYKDMKYKDISSKRLCMYANKNMKILQIILVKHTDSFRIILEMLIFKISVFFVV